MRDASLPRFHLVPSSIVIAGVIIGMILGLALLAFAGSMIAGPLDHSPDGPLLGPFRWIPRPTSIEV
jgi:hypothetical protein